MGSPFIRLVSCGFLLSLWCLSPWAEPLELPALSTTLEYAEDKVIPAPKRTGCGGGGLLGALDCIGAEIDNSGKPIEDQIETSTATQQLELTPLIQAPEGGRNYRVVLRVRGGSVQFDGVMQEQSMSRARADSRKVKASLSRWSRTLDDDQVEALGRGEVLHIAVERPFQGLQKLALMEPLEVVIDTPLAPTFNLDLEEVLTWMVKRERVIDSALET